jgi:hypothetical protein
LNRGLAFLALAGLAALPRALDCQVLPEALKESALAVRVHAVVPAASIVNLQGPGATPPETQGPSSPAPREKDWEVQSVKYTVPGTPVPFKFVGANVAILIQVTPFSRQDARGLVLVAQGQVWVHNKEGGISYRTTINTLSVNYGETVLFFPLGLDSTGKSPLRLEISVLRATDLPDSTEADPGATNESGDKAGK